VTTANALTVVQHAALPAQIVRPESAVPAAEAFAQQMANQSQARRPVAEPEAIEPRFRRSEGNVTFLRDRRRAADPRDDQDRRTAERREAKQERRSFQATNSGFLTQMIAQEIAPDNGRSRSTFVETSVAAYEATIERAEVFIDPFRTLAVNA